MTNDKECFKRYLKIQKKIENEGYVEWKCWIQDEIKDYDIHKIKNMLERYKIEMECLNEKYISSTEIIMQLLPIIVMVITLVITITNSTFSNIIGICNGVVQNVEDITGYVSNSTEVITKASNEMSNLVLKGTLIILLLVFICYISDIWLQRRKAFRKLYCKKVIEILEEKLEIMQEMRTN